MEREYARGTSGRGGGAEGAGAAMEVKEVEEGLGIVVIVEVVESGTEEEEEEAVVDVMLVRSPETLLVGGGGGGLKLTSGEGGTGCVGGASAVTFPNGMGRVCTWDGGVGL